MMGVANKFSLENRVAVVAGGGGVLGGAIAQGLAAAGARVAIADLLVDQAAEKAKAVVTAGGEARSYKLDVMQMDSIRACCDSVCKDFGGVNILVNAVGGNRKSATTSPEQSFFDLSGEGIRNVMELNLLGGTVFPCQVFGKCMAANEEGGSIINVSSMTALRPLTRIPGYSAAKAAVSNFTQWLAVHLAQEYSPKLHVNAIAPGFFLTEQNRYLLTDEKTGKLTERGKTIITHTPMGQFGNPEDLIGVTVWLASDASRFVTGIVIPIDGGFSAFSGV